MGFTNAKRAAKLRKRPAAIPPATIRSQSQKNKSAMKNKWRTLALILIGLIATLGVVITIAGYRCCHSPADGAASALTDQRPSANEAALTASPARIGLYDVPLRCPLVTRLGCGSESKPIMTRLD